MKIRQYKNIFPDLRVARYNLTAWQKPTGNSVFFIGREVTQAGEQGQPDNGILKLYEVNDQADILQERTIWEPSFNGINLEDPRALQLLNDNLIIGLTAVLRDKEGHPIPFPAIIKIDSLSSWNQKLPPFLIISSFGPGKNITPLDSYTYLFRPESPEYNHKILVFSLHHQVPEKLTDITFPTDLYWAQWRIGTTMAPIWINQYEAIFLIHGISKQTIQGTQKYIYSIGRAKLTKKNNTYTVTVAPEPIITPDDFIDEQGHPLIPELHPNARRVVYSCGGIIKKNQKDTLTLYVNVGDRTTYEVEFPLSELKAGLF